MDNRIIEQKYVIIGKALHLGNVKNMTENELQKIFDANDFNKYDYYTTNNSCTENNVSIAGYFKNKTN
jgi:hypothetical protein